MEDKNTQFLLKLIDILEGMSYKIELASIGTDSGSLFLDDVRLQLDKLKEEIKQ